MSMNNPLEESKSNSNSNSNSNQNKIQNPNPRITWEGCSVLLDINDGDRLVFARLTAASTLKIGNKNYLLQPLIGCPFGSLFQVENNGKDWPFLSRVSSTAEGNNSPEQGDSQVINESKDNRALVDNNMAQSLTSEDIEEMRRQGVTGNEIVEALIANSATFEKKTLFSQEKYRLKKQKKYAPRVLLRRPFARRFSASDVGIIVADLGWRLSICEAYFKKHPEKIGFMRMDSLSLLLSMANVTAHSDVLVVDLVGGILTGAVAERLGGTGYVCNTYRGVTPYPIDIIRIFNFSDEICERIVHASLSDLCSSQDGNSASANQLEDACEIGSQSNVDDATSLFSMEDIRISSGNEAMEITPRRSLSPIARTRKAAKAGQKATLDAIKSWKENGFSSLIVAAPDLDAWSIVKELLPLLSYSAPFAIYHQHNESLAACMRNLQLEKVAIGLQITEPFLREYQVLPSRTHPHMQMSAFGGYILSGTKISTPEKSCD